MLVLRVETEIDDIFAVRHPLDYEVLGGGPLVGLCRSCRVETIGGGRGDRLGKGDRQQRTDTAMPETSRDVHSTAIASTLESEIIAGEIAAGARLDEQSLTRRFGVSRTPVREALHMIVARSLAERVPYRGVIVAAITPERIEQMFEAMAEIEALCGRLASERMTMGERAALEDDHRRLGDVAARGAAAAYEQGNTVFHDRIHDGAHNADLAEASATLRLKLAPFRKSQLASADRMRRSNEEHAAIVSAILDRDPAETERALRRHFFSAAQEVLLGLRRRSSAEDLQ
ncbi:GntR family transcriptional regulator [Roseivivax marinus]|uniref:GntR family transcriptional regulator n=2 Tax=Roseivivax marinus TaxID=1379903 RepID=W4HK99_9RHOB|nr:GntR family transcriptional regulator [Roseivivax marinus]